MNLEELSIIIGKQIEVGWNDNFKEFHVSMPSVEISEGCVLIGTFGTGKTPESAKHNYAKQLAGKKIVVDAMREYRKEYQIPDSLE